MKDKVDSGGIWTQNEKDQKKLHSIICVQLMHNSANFPPYF